LAAASVWAQPVGGESARPYGASRPIDGQYIVVFNQRVTNPTALAAQLSAQANAQVLFTYSNSIRGFAGRMSAQAAEGLARNPNVEFVEQDATVSLSETRIDPPAEQANATWGIDRIDQRARPLDGQYRYRYTGAGVYAFIVDTGIRPDHVDFGGRVVAGATSITDGRGTDDCDGHGTHVAGTVGGSTWGVAKGVTLVPVRVLDCSGSGTWSGVIAGVDWVAGQTAMRPAVANMSLGGGLSSSVNAAVARAVDAGVTMVVAAGNSNADACRSSPASEPKALTVGATTSSDARASYSNYGPCLDLFAPGSSITSTWIGGTTNINTISGTSMASPHVAGAAALVLAENPSATPGEVAQSIIGTAVTGVVTSAGTGSPNRLLFTMADPVVPQTVAVAALTGAAISVKTGWRATVTARIGQATDTTTGVSGVTVTGRFGTAAAVSCVTGSAGTCALSSATYKSSVGNVTFSVTGVSGPGITYASGSNVTNQVVIYKP
jgi:subtilisin family serine protease